MHQIRVHLQWLGMLGGEERGELGKGWREERKSERERETG